jgi:hypothetical protein
MQYAITRVAMAPRVTDFSLIPGSPLCQVTTFLNSDISKLATFTELCSSSWSYLTNFASEMITKVETIHVFADDAL